ARRRDLDVPGGAFRTHRGHPRARRCQEPDGPEDPEVQDGGPQERPERTAEGGHHRGSRRVYGPPRPWRKCQFNNGMTIRCLSSAWRIVAHGPAEVGTRSALRSAMPEVQARPTRGSVSG